MQVFASGIDAQVKLAQQVCHTIDNVASNLQRLQVDLGLEQSAVRAVADAPTFQHSLDEDSCSFGQDHTESNLHADLSDEPVPVSGFRFTSHSSALPLAHGHDSVREPPFLPLISPPPRA